MIDNHYRHRPRPRPLVFLLVMVLLAAGLFAPVGAQENVEANATLRIVHASAGAPAIDVLVDGQPLAQDVEYGEVTDFVPLSADEHQIQVVPTGQTAENAIVDESFDADAGKAYIFTAFGPLNEIEGKIFEVDLDRVEDAKARVRVIHLAADAGDVDVTVTGGDELFGGVGFGDDADYRDLDPGTYSIDVRGSEDRVLVTVPELTFLPGRVYDIIALGQLSDQSVQLLSLETSVSRPCTEVLGLEGDAENACLRIVHASPGSPDVDFYANESPLAPGLTFGAATEFIAVPSGDDRKIQVTAAGASLDNAVLDADIDLRAGQAYQVMATGMLDELEATVNEIDLSPLPENQARIRLLHASPDAGNVDLGIADGELIFEDIDFRDGSDYKVIDAGAYTFEVRKAGEDTVVLRPDVQLEAGMTYDVIALGRADDGTLAVSILATVAATREGGLATPGADTTTSPSEAATTTSVADDVDEDESDAAETGENAAETAEANDGGEPTPTPIS